MNLRTKILAGFGGILALVVIVWLWAIVHLNQLGNASEAILQENYRSILAAESMLSSLERQDSATLLMLAGDVENAVVQFRSNEVQFLQWLGRAQDNVTIVGEADTLRTIQEAYTEYLAVVPELHTPPGSASGDLLAVYRERVQPRFEEVRAEIVALRNLNQTTMTEASQRAQAVARSAIWSTVAVGSAVSILGLALSLWFSRFLARPLQAMIRAAGRIAEGDYDVVLDTGSGDELGRLAGEIMTMSNKLKAFHRLNVGQVFAEKRRSEAIINSIGDGLVVVDAGLTVIALNPTAAQIFGVTAEAATGRPLFDIVQDRNLYEQIKRAAHTGHAPDLAEDETFYIVERNSANRYYRYSVTPVKAEHHDLLGVVLLLQDVTDLKELDRLKSDFVMTASHELRTPLTAMSMSLTLLAERASSKLSEEEQELLDAAEEEVVRLRALVDDLLNLSKIEAGHMDLEFETVPAGLLVEKAVAAFGAQAEAAGIELTTHVADPVPAVWADANKIAWVLSNLIGNALRYTEAGGHINVAALPRGSNVVFSVADDGAGIPLEYQSRIFDKFVQVRDAGAAGGTGLGLTICKEVVKAHGGIIWLESQVGVGSTFTFSLPSARVDPEQRTGEPNGTETVSHSRRGR